MATLSEPKLSIVVPVFNEQAALPTFHESLQKSLEDAKLTSYEIIYVNDGSSDATNDVVKQFCKDNDHVKLISFSRNFGKELALTAGITHSRGQATLTLDGDGQHPVELIAKFVDTWKQGAKVVVGVRSNDAGDGLRKRLGSKLFYRVFNSMTKQKLVPGSTDYRLIDAAVRREFVKLQETDRMTRALIDWLGFQPVYIPFTSKPRQQGKPTYTQSQLAGLALDSFISLTPLPLYIFGCLGIVITTASLVLGVAVFIEQLLFSDPLGWHFTGTAMLSILILFLVGLILMSQGLLSLYVSRVHTQAKQRPLFVIDYDRSERI